MEADLKVSTFGDLSVALAGNKVLVSFTVDLAILEGLGFALINKALPPSIEPAAAVVEGLVESSLGAIK